jgi:hypothetical protein
LYNHQACTCPSSGLHRHICSPSSGPSIVFRSPMQLQSIMQKIDGILPEIEEMQRRGLIEIQNLNFKFRLANLI